MSDLFAPEPPNPGASNGKALGMITNMRMQGLGVQAIRAALIKAMKGEIADANPAIIKAELVFMGVVYE